MVTHSDIYGNLNDFLIPFSSREFSLFFFIRSDRYISRNKSENVYSPGDGSLGLSRLNVEIEIEA